MNPLLIRLIVLGIIGWAGSEIFKSEKEFKPTKNSNCDSLFKLFNQKIEISPEKVMKLKRAHNTIREKLWFYFSEYTSLPSPEFFIQGSYKTKTLVENAKTKCDVDLGIFFTAKPNIKIEAIQKHIKKALDNHTTRGVEIKKNCVRLNYVSDFHIDLPIYYKTWSGNTYFGAKGNGWESSDPKEFISWFKRKTKNKPQLIRVIRYLKAWADNMRVKHGKKMPSGLALTIWAVKYYQSNARDDIAFLQTTSVMLAYLDDYFKFLWKAEMPVKPYDNVLNRFTKTQKSVFYEEFKYLVSTAASAVTQKNKQSAILKWRQVFGYRFGS